MSLARSDSNESRGSHRLRRSDSANSAISQRNQLPSPGAARADGLAMQGTALTFYQRTLDSNPDWPGVKNYFASISAQAAYRTHSVEELRAIDYARSGSYRASYCTTDAKDPANPDAVFAAIASMPEYNDVSHEEIRLADYWYHPADAGLLTETTQPTFGKSPRSAPAYLEIDQFNALPYDADEVVEEEHVRDTRAVDVDSPQDTRFVGVDTGDDVQSSTPSIGVDSHASVTPALKDGPTEVVVNQVNSRSPPQPEPNAPYELRAPPPPPPVPLPPVTSASVASSVVEPSSPNTDSPEESSPNRATRDGTSGVDSSKTKKKNQQDKYDDDEEPTSLLAQLQEMMRQAQQIKKGDADHRLAHLRETAQMFNRSLGLKVEKKASGSTGTSAKPSRRENKREPPSFERKFNDRDSKPIVESDDESTPNLGNQRRFPSAMALPDSPSSAAISEDREREVPDDFVLPSGAGLDHSAVVDDGPSMPSLESMKLASVKNQAHAQAQDNDYTASEAESDDLEREATNRKSGCRRLRSDGVFENTDMPDDTGGETSVDENDNHRDDEDEVKVEKHKSTPPATVLERVKQLHSRVTAAEPIAIPDDSTNTESESSLNSEKKTKSKSKKSSAGRSASNSSLARTKTLRSVAKSPSRKQSDDDKKQKDKRMESYLEDAAAVVRAESLKVVQRSQSKKESTGSNTLPGALQRTTSTRKPRRPPLARDRPRAPPGAGVPAVSRLATDSATATDNAEPPAGAQLQAPQLPPKLPSQPLAHSVSHATISRPPVPPMISSSVRKTSSMSGIARIEPKVASAAATPVRAPQADPAPLPPPPSAVAPPAPSGPVQPAQSLARSVSKSVADVVPKKKAKRARDDESSFSAPSADTTAAASEDAAGRSSSSTSNTSTQAFSKPFLMQPLETNVAAPKPSNPYRSGLFSGISPTATTANTHVVTSRNPFGTPSEDKLNFFGKKQTAPSFALRLHDGGEPSDMFHSLDLTPAPFGMTDRERTSRAKSFPAIGTDVGHMGQDPSQTRTRPVSSGTMFSSAFQMFEERTTTPAAQLPITSSFGMSESQSRECIPTTTAGVPVRSRSRNSSGSSNVSWSRVALNSASSGYADSRRDEEVRQMDNVFDSWRPAEQPMIPKSEPPPLQPMYQTPRQFHVQPQYINREFKDLAARKKSAPELGFSLPAYRSTDNLGLPLLAPSSSTTSYIAEALHGPSALAASKSLPVIEHSLRHNEVDPGSTGTNSSLSSPPSDQKEPISSPAPIVADAEKSVPVLKKSLASMVLREPIEEEEEPVSAKSILSTGSKRDEDGLHNRHVSFRDVESVAIADRETPPDVGGLDTIRKPAPLPPYATDGGDNKSNDGYDSEFSGSAEYEDCRDEISVSLKGSNSDTTFWQKAFFSAKARAEAAEINALERQSSSHSKETRNRKTIDQDYSSASGRDEFQDAEEGEDSFIKLDERRSPVAESIHKRMQVFQNATADTDEKSDEKMKPRSVLLPKPPAILPAPAESNLMGADVSPPGQSVLKNLSDRFFTQKNKEIEPPTYAPPPRSTSRSAYRDAANLHEPPSSRSSRTKSAETERPPSRSSRAKSGDPERPPSRSSRVKNSEGRSSDAPSQKPSSVSKAARRATESSLPPAPLPPFELLESDGLRPKLPKPPKTSEERGNVTSKKSEREASVRKTASERHTVKSKSSKVIKTRSSAANAGDVKKSRRVPEPKPTPARERISFPTPGGDDTMDLRDPQSMERMQVKKKSKAKRDDSSADKVLRKRREQQKQIPEGVRKRMDAVASLSNEEAKDVQRVRRRTSSRARDALRRGDADAQRGDRHRVRKTEAKKRYALPVPLRTQSDFGEPAKRNDSDMRMLDERADTDLPAHGKSSAIFEDDRASSSLAVLPVANSERQVSLSRRHSLPSRQSSDVREPMDKNTGDETKAQRTHTMLASLWGGRDDSYGALKARRASTDLDEQRAKRHSSLAAGAGLPGRNIEDSSSDLDNNGGLLSGVRRLFSRRLRRKERERAGISGGASGQTDRASIAGVPDDRNARGSMTRGSMGMRASMQRGSTGMRGSITSGRGSLVGRRDARRSKSEHKNNKRRGVLFKNQ